MIQSLARAFLVALVCAYGAQAALAQTPSRLEPADFVVAGVPDNFPDLFIESDTVQIRRILGNPVRVRIPKTRDEGLSVWFYDGLEVSFGGIARQGITFTSPRVATHRGLRVGDSEQRVLALYGQPAERIEDEWVYEDPRERLHVVTVTVRGGKVVSIYVGSMWD